MFSGKCNFSTTSGFWQLLHIGPGVVMHLMVDSAGAVHNTDKHTSRKNCSMRERATRGYLKIFGTTPGIKMFT